MIFHHWHDHPFYGDLAIDSMLLNGSQQTFSNPNPASWQTPHTINYVFHDLKHDKAHRMNLHAIMKSVSGKDAQDVLGSKKIAKLAQTVRNVPPKLAKFHESGTLTISMPLHEDSASTWTVVANSTQEHGIELKPSKMQSKPKLAAVDVFGVHPKHRYLGHMIKAMMDFMGEEAIKP